MFYRSERYRWGFELLDSFELVFWFDVRCYIVYYILYIYIYIYYYYYILYYTLLLLLYLILYYTLLFSYSSSFHSFPTLVHPDLSVNSKYTCRCLLLGTYIPSMFMFCSIFPHPSSYDLSLPFPYSFLPILPLPL